MTASISFSIQVRFAHALAIVRAIPENSILQPITAADKLQFYGFYKQATEGDCNIPRPSSRQVVDYAKWKSWCRMKGISPVEAQKLYIESLIQLLTELIHRYPRHEQTYFLKKALHGLEEENMEGNEEDQELFQDAEDFETQDHFLNNIEADQLMPINSPPLSSNNSNKYNNSRRNTLSNDDYPLTPVTSPGQNSSTGQWVLNQLQQQRHHHQSNNSGIHPMDYMQHRDDLVSEADTLDREVAAATSKLVLSSPRQSPYTPQKSTTKHTNSSSPGSVSTSTSSSAKAKSNNKKSTKERALEKLQTEVTALTEQIDCLRRTSIDNQKIRKYTIWYICKTLVKHLVVNSVILLLIFYVLYKRKSPIADKVFQYLMPMFQEFIRKILKRIVFWKITV